ncbi:MAG: hypothetical protein IPP71_19715 [Bacteroidetes bacterium]|nr:hypothetical protein [Bacteroidota bacterium]
MKAINYFDDAGNLVFYMYLIDDTRDCTMTLKFSIDSKMIITKNTERYIRCIEERKVQADLREHFIEKLFECIRKECNLTAVKHDEINYLFTEKCRTS